MESVNVFFIDPLYEWNMWMFSLIFVNWMEYMNGFFIVCLYEWNLWMFSLSLVYMNGICECFLYRLFRRMESVNVFYTVSVDMNGLRECV